MPVIVGATLITAVLLLLYANRSVEAEGPIYPVIEKNGITYTILDPPSEWPAGQAMRLQVEIYNGSDDEFEVHNYISIDTYNAVSNSEPVIQVLAPGETVVHTYTAAALPLNIVPAGREVTLKYARYAVLWETKVLLV